MRYLQTYEKHKVYRDDERSKYDLAIRLGKHYKTIISMYEEEPSQDALDDILLYSTKNNRLNLIEFALDNGANITTEVIKSALWREKKVIMKILNNVDKLTNNDLNDYIYNHQIMDIGVLRNISRKIDILDVSVLGNSWQKSKLNNATFQEAVLLEKPEYFLDLMKFAKYIPLNIQTKYKDKINYLKDNDEIGLL